MSETSVNDIKGLILDRRALQEIPLRDSTALITIADPGVEPAHSCTPEKVVAQLHLAFHDIGEPIATLQEPTAEHAQQVLAFFKDHASAPAFAVQCEAGVGRSQAAMAGIMRLCGGDNSSILQQGTYNRMLYSLLAEEMDKPLPADPLVSMVVRIKYPTDRLLAFALCMFRQRYANWELIAVTDGPVAFQGERVFLYSHPQGHKIHILETKEAKGRWGHPYRQLGIEQAKGKYIGLSNDDNYYTPGYLEQMVYGLELGADLILCDHLHSNAGWQSIHVVADVGSADIGCWLAQAEVLQAVPFTGEAFYSDGEHVERMVKHVGVGRVKCLRRPLFVHN